MAVRKVYDVVVSDRVVYSGSYKTALVVYESFSKHFAHVSDPPPISIAFKPVLKKGDIIYG